jgi:hypothetical protein
MSESLVYRLPIHSELADSSEAAVRAAVEEALVQAIADAKSEYKVDAESEVEGAFGGVGEGIIIVTILHFLKAGGIEVAKGALEATGAVFVNKYLAPLLRKRNILPGKVESVSTGKSPAKSGKKKK